MERLDEARAWKICRELADVSVIVTEFGKLLTDPCVTLAGVAFHPRHGRHSL